MNLSEFFYENFVKGWNERESYNIFDTVAYALLAVIIIMASYPLIKNKIKLSN